MNGEKLCSPKKQGKGKEILAQMGEKKGCPTRGQQAIKRGRSEGRTKPPESKKKKREGRRSFHVQGKTHLVVKFQKASTMRHNTL